MTKWYERLNPFHATREKDAAELKAAADAQEKQLLERQLEAVMGEFKDTLAYEAKFFDADSTSFSGGGFFDIGGIDQIMSAQSLAKLYSTETWVYVAVNAIAQTIAGLPIKLEKRRKIKQTVENTVTGEEEDVEQEVWIDASGEKLAQRFLYPNPHCSKTEFLTLLLIDLLTTGQYFVWLDSDQDLTTLDYISTDGPDSAFGRLRQIMATDTPVKAMYRIPPALIKAVPSETNYGVEGYVMQSERGMFAYNQAEIVNVKLPNPLDSFAGLPPLVAAIKPVLIDRFSTEHMIRFYKSGARLGGVVETDKALNKEQLSRFQRSFENNYTGRANHHRTLILPPGMKYSPIEQNPAQTALLDFCKYNREAILAAYKVPPIKAGVLDGANYANARAQLRSFLKDTVIPVISFVQDGFNGKRTLMPDIHTYRMKFDLSEVEELQDDGLALGNVAKGMLDSGATVNEVRKKVWKLQPIDGGDEAPVIARIKRDTMNTEIGLGLAGGAAPTPSAEGREEAPAPGEEAVDQNREEVASEAITDPTLSLNGAQVQAMLSVIQQVNGGLLPRGTGVELLVAAFSIPRDAAERIMGPVGNGFQPNPSVSPESIINLDAGQADGVKDAPTDIKPTKVSFSERVNQLVAQYVQEGTPLNQAVPKAIEQAKAEGFDPNDEDPTDPDGTPPSDKPEESAEPRDSVEDKTGPASLDQFLRDRLSQLGNAPVDAAVVNQLIAEFETGTTPAKQIAYPNGAQKDVIVAHWKGFVDKTEPMVLKRALAVRTFFDKVKSIVMNRLGANVKAYGVMKARDNEDIDEILNTSAYEQALKEYAAAVDAALLEAAKFGYGDTLVEFKLGGRNEKEIADLIRKYLGTQIKGINGTTLDQIRQVLANSFEAGEAIGETSRKLQEKFAEMQNGRAVTIARTETLTAVSLGREMKRADFRQEFPNRKLMKMWVSAQDDRVRDSHVELDGTSVEDGEEFANGLMFPRDPSGEASEVINCRCTEITYFEEDGEAVESTLNGAPGKLAPMGKVKIFTHCAAGIHPDDEKGGPGSGCHGSNCGRPAGSGNNEGGSDTSSNEGAKPSNSSSSRLSPEVQKLVGRREKGKGEAIELSREQMTEVLEKGTYALVSAGKNIKDPEDNALSDEQVKQRYDQLEADLKASGYAYTRVAGHYGAKEDTFLVQVHEANRDEMTALGEKYKQDSIIYTTGQKNEMIYTTGEHKGKKQTGEGYTWQDEADDFYTVVTHPNGKVSKFQLNFDFDTQPKFYCPTHGKGGPGSGCHGPNCGRPSTGGTDGSGGQGAGASTEPYDRPKVKPLADGELTGGQRNNFQNIEGARDNPTLMDKKGKDITPVDTRVFVKYSEMEAATEFIPALNKAAEALKSEGVNLVSYKVRAKDAQSLTDKMNGKWQDKTLNQVTDGIGGRLVLENQRNADMATAKFARLTGMKILEHTDYAENPKDTGYRATHLLVRTKNGMIAEVQIKTRNQDTWSKWSHDQIYKNDRLKDNPDVRAYGKAVSDYLYQRDLGKPSGERPAAPQAVKDADLEFPWDKVRD